MSETHGSAELETQLKDVSLPTSSMISVRLSDYISNKEAFSPRTPRESPCNSAKSVPSRPRSISVASSRSSTPTSSSEAGSYTPVNWEGLEKTEEQEPRDEGTDEVCHPCNVLI